MIVLKKWSLLIHISLFALFGLFLFMNSFETADLRSQDFLYQQERPTSPDIVIIAIDDESLSMLGRWPWPRDYHGELIRQLSEGEPAAIAFDVIFVEPSALPEDDAYLVAMTEEAGNVVIPAYGAFGATAQRGMLEAQALFTPFTELEQAAAAVGHINTLISNDGIVRRTVVQFAWQEEIINSFAFETYNRYAAHTGRELLTAAEIPVGPWHRTFIRFSGEPFDFEILPYHMILTGEIPGEYFRDKIVVIGPMAVGIADDYYFTPMAPQVPMYGVEIHANIMQQFIDRKFFTPLGLGAQYAIMLAMAAAGFGLFYRFRPGGGFAVLVGLVAAYLLAASMAGARPQGYIFSFIYPLGLVGTQYVVVLGQKFIEEQLEKKRVTDVFGKYVAPQIVGKILEEGESGLKLGGTRRDLTILFVDIRGFTPLSESATPEEVVSILNDYLTLCANSIFAYGGTLDKYIGDAAMALYNAPFDLENHQLRAVQTAWAMHEGAQPLQKELEERFGKTVRFGVGIHTGSAIVGNVGAAFRMDYTAIGDTVNTAARIESNTKPGQIMISQEVYEHVKDYVEVTDLGTIQVKGKAVGIRVYQVDNVLNMERPEGFGDIEIKGKKENR